MIIELPKGILGLEKLNEKCKNNLVKNIEFTSNVIGCKYIEFEQFDRQKYSIDLVVPKEFKIKREKLEEFVNSISNFLLVNFLFKILDNNYI